MCRLQTIPDDYEIQGGVTETQRQIGNAVPSLIGEILGREIRKQFFKDEVKEPLKLLLPKNNNKFREEPLQPVVAKYLNLVGSHEDHPGTGRGTQAIQNNAVI